MKFWNQKFLCMIYIDFFKFVETKFNVNVVFAQLFINSFWLKIGTYRIHISLILDKSTQDT